MEGKDEHQSMEMEVYKGVKMEGKGELQSMEMEVYKGVVEMEGKGEHQSMEMEVYKGVKPGAASTMNGARRLYYLEKDVGARTTDPVKMEENMRFSLSYAILHGFNLVLASHVDPNDEFVMSPEYFLSVLPKCGKIVEAIKLKLSKKAPLPETIHRKQRFCVGIRRVLKSKNKFNKLRSLQKHWEKNQKRKERRMERSKLKAIAMKEKLEREAASKKPTEFASNTIVAKADRWEVTLSSVSTLAYHTYLNDEVLDYGVALVMKRHRNGPDAISVGVPGWMSFFCLTPDLQNDLSRSRRYYIQLHKRVPNLLALKYIVVPIVRDSHWFLVIICQPFPDEATVLDLERKAGGGQNMKQYSKLLYHKWLTGKCRPKILVFDSLTYRPGHRVMDLELKEFYDTTASCVRCGLFALHKQLWSNTGRSIDFNKAIESRFLKQVPHQVMKVPGQNNKDDCGLYVITYVMLWFTELKKVNDDYTGIFKRDFRDVFPYKACYNLRHSLYKKIEDYCSSTPELQKRVMEHRVLSYFEIKPESRTDDNDEKVAIF